MWNPEGRRKVGLPNYVVKDCRRRQKELSWSSWNVDKHVARGSLKESWISGYIGEAI